MGNKNPNGNIIVDASGGYNHFDAGMHEHIFEKIKQHYVIGDPSASRFFTAAEIQLLAPGFVAALANILGTTGATPIELISCYGRVLSEKQVEALLRWIDRTLGRARS